jgi:hypothetical protein
MDAEGDVGFGSRVLGRLWARRNRLVLWALILLCAGWYFRRPLFETNLGVVDAGRVYRSAQPAGVIGDWADRYGFASVLNLRGGSPSDRWYSEEVAATKGRGIDYYDYPMDAGSRPGRRQLLALIDLFSKCRYPLLIHCKKGADRTGLAAVVYLMTVRGEAPERASRGFTLEHAHIPLFGPERLHEPIDGYARWLKARGFGHTPERFREWVMREYDGEDGPRMAASMEPGSRFERGRGASAAGRK